MLSRRQLIFGTSTLVLAAPSFAATKHKIHVFKGRGCGCCTVWSDILKTEGFTVSEEELFPSDLARLKAQQGIPDELASCHTAKVAGYIIEGHVPPADIHRLLTEKPIAIGISVPGMPYGSPGMGPESEREAYNVLLIRRDGRAEIFTSYQAGNS